MPDGTNSLRQRIYEQLRDAIAHGALKPGMRLPPSREHATLLGVSRNTVLWALERLQFEGYLVTRVGDGTYVSPQASGFRTARPHIVQPGEADLSRRGRRMAETAVSWGPRPEAPHPFRIGAPDLNAFPFALWGRLTRQTAGHTLRQTSNYQPPGGHPPLRAAIAGFLAVSRGIRCTPEQVLVTSGSQQAIDLVARLLLDEGDEVLVEDPGYLGIRASLLAHGARVHGVPVDREGLIVGDGAARHPQARLAIVTPTHQFPLGVTMSLGRRLELLQWVNGAPAGRRSAEARRWVIEDDYDGEFQYANQSMPALCSIDRSGRVLYAGTFSKILHAGIRLGYLVLPPGLVEAFARAKAIADRHSPGLTQDVLARFITEGHLLEHLRRMRELYLARQRCLIDTLAHASSGMLQLLPSPAGMHLAHEAPPGTHDLALTRRAREIGIELAPISLFCLEAPRRGWLLGYSGYDEAEITAAAQQVARLLGERQALAPGRA